MHGTTIVGTTIGGFLSILVQQHKSCWKSNGKYRNTCHRSRWLCVRYRERFPTQW